MTNYKPVLDTLLARNVIRRKSTSTALVYLFDQVNGSSGADSMTDIADNLVYQVPTGKRFIITEVTVHVALTGGGSISIYEGATENAQTTLEQVVPVPYIPSQSVTMFVGGSNKFDAGTFVVIKPSSIQTVHVEMLGYEEFVS